MRKQMSASAFGFDRYDKGRLSRALAKSTNAKVYVRLKALLLVAEGMPVTKVAEFFDKSRRIVYRWIATYLSNHQPWSLEEGARSGRPLAAQGITDQRILRELKRNPLKLGYHTTVWTVEILAWHLSQRYGCEIGRYTLYRRMKQIGLVCKRPRYVYAEKDPHRAQKKGRLSES
jgi:transposase